MAFEMNVVSHSPMTGEEDPKRVAQAVFGMMGYVGRKGPDNGVGFRMLYDCFLMHPSKEWTIEQLASACDTTMPSIYRHLNKLKDYDIIEDTYTEDRKRAFRLRYGDLSKAWNFCEAHFQLAVENYRKSIDHLESLLRKQRLEGIQA